jgi:hypothetical protein
MGTSESIISKISDAFFSIFHADDETTELKVDLTGSTTGKKVTITSEHTDDRNLALPDKSGTIETEESNRSAQPSLTIDFKTSEIQVISMGSSGTLSLLNPVQGKVILLEVNGNGFTLSFPTTVRIITGTFKANTLNYIYLHCTNITGPVYVATIGQQIA